MMLRTLVALSFPVCMAACTTVPDWPDLLLKKRDDAPLAHYRFDWQLSGDRAVAPLQVFDDGHRTWLQFSPGQPVPAIFEHAAHGERPLRYTREGAYIVLPGVWDTLMFRGGALQGMARRMSARTPGAASVETNAVAAAAPEVAPAAMSGDDELASFQTIMETDTAAFTLPAGEVSQDISATDPAVTVLPVEAEPLRAPIEHYDVSPRDLTLRAALARWAGMAGWTFEPEHWTVDADIPIVGSASFALAFKPAVQELVASTELADKPLQPCFYSNRVLRIVPYAQPCDRTVGASGTS